jgi:hypothetical protein
MLRSFPSTFVFVCLHLLLINADSQGAGEGSGIPSGSIQLPSGLLARYEYHFNRNALGDVQQAGKSLIALTGSGNLLRFDAATLRPSGEWYGPVSVTCLGRGAAGSVLAGFEDGRVCRIDVESLQPSDLAKLSGKPQWIEERGGKPAGGTGPKILAVVEQTKWIEHEGRRYPMHYSVIQDMATGKSIPLEELATAFLLDRSGSLWLGADEGEWGGWCSVYDSKTGTLRSIPGRTIYKHEPDKEFWLGVFGFFEQHDGQVWAHGGITHMGSTNGYIWRGDRGRAEEVYYLDNSAEIKAFRQREMADANAQNEAAGAPPDHANQPETDPLPKDRPHLPITHIVQNPQTRDLIILSFSDVYRTDENLKRWRKAYEIDIQYRSGRPDAVGAYPSIRAVRLVDGKERLVCATRLDGLVDIADGKVTTQTIPGQVNVEDVDRFESTKEGLLVIEDDDGDLAWQLQRGAWVERSFAPAFKPAPGQPGDDAAFGVKDWSETRLLVSLDGTIFTISSTSVMPGTHMTARRQEGKAEVLNHESSMLSPAASFLTPDGKIWNAGFESLSRLDKGKWSSVYKWVRGGNQGVSHDFGWGLRTVNEARPPWFLLDRQNKALVRLAPGVSGPEPPIRTLTLHDGDRKLEVLDAIAWTRETLLLATDQGLKTFETASGKVTPASLPALDRKVSRLCRDRLGRLWAGGDGLSVVEADGKTVHTFDAIPMLGRSTVNALALDPAHPDGIVAGMAERGVLFVQSKRGS